MSATLPVTLTALVGLGLAGVRWLRVAQREHYLAGAALRFARRWWLLGPLNGLLGALAVAGAVAVWFEPWAGLATAAAVAVGPRGLGLRGRTSKLAWTRRLRTLAAITVVLAAVVLLVSAWLGAAAPVAVALALLAPLLVDAGLAAAAPIERRLARRFVDQASRTLRSVSPTIVAITGSYGKTTVKGYVRHLVAPARTVVASPASFNNTAGLSRAVNEHLAPGTEVFVAEMGTYGPGEIRDLCSWVQPRIAAITAIGPVHLERMGSLENIATAKAEILESAEVAVLNVDSPHLTPIADRVGRYATVYRCSTSDPGADVHVAEQDGELVVSANGERIGSLPAGSPRPGNVACAVAIALALEVPAEVIARALPGLSAPDHRQQVSRTSTGVTVIDDTFNANPDGAAAALELLRRHGDPRKRRAVVTPGMVELGGRQERDNTAFAAAAGKVATDVLIVGRTNRAALLEGARGGAATVHVVDSRDDAVEWIRANLRNGDAVLYENDLPDHYP